MPTHVSLTSVPRARGHAARADAILSDNLLPLFVVSIVGLLAQGLAPLGSGDAVSLNLFLLVSGAAGALCARGDQRTVLDRY